MNTETLMIDPLARLPVLSPPSLESSTPLLQSRLPSLPTILPHFEFVVEVAGEIVWSGLDLPGQYPLLCQQYPEPEIVISWRSAPVVWV